MGAAHGVTYRGPMSDPAPSTPSSEPAPAQQPSTTAITAGRAASGTSLAPALFATTTWESAGLDDANRRATGMRAGQFYSRYANPTVRSFEEAVAALEGAEDALAFSSGMGAVASVVLALCSSGDHVVAQRQLYAGTIAFLQGPCARFGIETTLVDAREPGAFAAAVRPGKTMLVLAETPSNPRLDLVDLDEIGEPARADHRRRLDPRHAARSATARPWRAPLAPLRDQGDRRAQRRDARRRRRRARAHGRDLGLRRAPRRHPVAVRRAQRPARHPHARGAHHASRPTRRSSSPNRCAGTRRSGSSTTPGCRTTRSATSPSGRCG